MMKCLTLVVKSCMYMSDGTRQPGPEGRATQSGPHLALEAMRFRLQASFLAKLHEQDGLERALRLRRVPWVSCRQMANKPKKALRIAKEISLCAGPALKQLSFGWS
jgi:hypothetical protein